MARPWYSFYPADYGRDTGHLTLVEHGAYRVLMDHYYANAAPLPMDIERLLHICRAKTRAERKAVRFVLGEFFEAGADGYSHGRIDAEIAKAAEITARCSRAAQIGNAMRSRKAAGAGADAGAGSPPSQSPSQSQEIDSCFAEFWTAYPRKEARGAAAKAFVRACMKAEPNVLIAAAAAYAARRAGQDAKFTKLPATWLEQECWLDDAGAVVDEAGVRAAWAGRAAALVEEIGGAAFQAYFSGAEFSPGPPATIRVGKAHLRELIARKFSGALARALGEFSVELKA